MKKNKVFIYFGLVMMILTSMGIQSCKKEQTTIQKTEPISEQSLKDSQLEQRIIAFRNKIDQIRENPALKSGTEPMEIDSAIWYIEACSNLTYGDASYDSEICIIDSALIEVSVTNGEILWTDLQIAYDQIIDSLSLHYANIVANEKQLIVADILLKESDENSATFEVISGFGTDGTLGFGNDNPWYWGWELGRCDGSGLGTGKDAADIIAVLANILIAVPSGNSYYTDVSIQEVWPNDVPTNNNPYGNYLLFSDYQEVTLIHHCLTTAEIDYYKNALFTIGNMYKPVDKSIISFFLRDDTAFGLTPNNDDYWLMVHVLQVKYGIWHISNDPPEDL